VHDYLQEKKRNLSYRTFKGDDRDNTIKNDFRAVFSRLIAEPDCHENLRFIYLLSCRHAIYPWATVSKQNHKLDAKALLPQIRRTERRHNKWQGMSSNHSLQYKLKPKIL